MSKMSGLKNSQSSDSQIKGSQLKNGQSQSNSNQKFPYPSRSYASKHQRPQINHHVSQALQNHKKNDLLFFKEPKQGYLISKKHIYYEGDFINGLPNGKGFAIYPSGDYFQGNFKDGQVEDKKGKIIISNGAYYQGNIEKSIVNGKGKLTHGQYSYDGLWVNGVPEGQGVQKLGGVFEYKGTFKNGKKSGEGKLKNIPEKEQYLGNFQDGLMDGNGKISSNGTIVYDGIFSKGKKIGNGKVITEKGTLQGHFDGDILNGKGTFTWKDGRVYRGQFLNNQFNGYGQVTLKNSVVLKGNWINGQCDNLMSVPKK